MNRLEWKTKEHRERTLRNQGDEITRLTNTMRRSLKGITRKFTLIRYHVFTDEMLLENERLWREEYPTCEHDTVAVLGDSASPESPPAL